MLENVFAGLFEMALRDGPFEMRPEIHWKNILTSSANSFSIAGRCDCMMPPFGAPFGAPFEGSFELQRVLYPVESTELNVKSGGESKTWLS